MICSSSAVLIPSFLRDELVVLLAQRLLVRRLLELRERLVAGQLAREDQRREVGTPLVEPKLASAGSTPGSTCVKTDS